MKYIKKLFTLILATLGCSAALALTDAGQMTYNPNLWNADFKYSIAMNEAKANLNSEVALQAEFTWYGSYGAPVTGGHAVLAFTQTAATNRPLNSFGQMFYSHGAGAFVGPRGLELELWYRSDANGNGFNDDTQNAFVWNQDNNRCVVDVAGTIPPGVYCISGTPSTTGEYITAAPSFQLKKGVKYVVRIKLKPSSVYANRTRIEAQLLEQGYFGKTLIQSGAIDFVTSDFFPTMQDLQATVARAPGAADEAILNWKLQDSWN